jgi:hypothetical protein
MQDYEGYAGFHGFAQATESDAEALNKALAAGYQAPRADGGGALRVESLEQTMRITTFSQQHIQLWRDFPKLPAYSTVEEYNIQTSYGLDNGGFTREGELAQVQDAAYQRKSAMVKFLTTQREVTHVQTLVKPAHGNQIALETSNGAIWILQQMEQALFRGNSAIIPESFDGIATQILNDAEAARRNVIDLRGGVLTEDRLEEGANLVIEGFGVPGSLYAAPRSLSDLNKVMYPRERFNLPAPVNGIVGINVEGVRTSAGIVMLKANQFLKQGGVGKTTAPTAATATRAATAPTIAVADPGATAGSKFTAADIGTFRYKVTAVNRFGESAASASSAQAVAAAGESVTVTITDGGGADGATGYRIYRSAVGGAAGSEVLITEVPRTGATTVFSDLNEDLPGTSRAFMMQMNLQALSYRQLAPLMKIPLATISLAIRWAMVLYGMPIIYQPLKHVIFKNAFDRAV